MAMLHIWIKHYDDCMDGPSQSHVFYAPLETHKMTSLMDCGTYGL